MNHLCSPLLPLAAAAALALAPAMPAMAAQADPNGPSPSQAALGSALGPVAVGAASALWWNLRLPGGVSDVGAIYVLALAPLGLGAGHWLAGEPGRGLAVGLGGYAAAGVGLGAGIGLASLGPSALSWSTSGAISAGVALASLVTLGYSTWAVLDAAETARRAAARPRRAYPAAP